MKLFAICFLLTASVSFGQAVATVYVTAPQVWVISADTMQLSAIARDASGNAIANATFQWSSNNSSVIQVDSHGMATAGALGIADVTATSSGRQGVIRLQVLPQRISISPADKTIVYGSQQQFTAVAYDVNGQPMPGVSFAWHVLVAGGAFDSATIGISPAGMITANTLGYYVIRASVVYSQGVDQFEREFDGSTTLTIVPADYAMSDLASSSVTFPSFHLLGKRTQIAANDSGTLALPVSLDGLTAALMTAQRQSLTPLAVAGTPGLVPGTQYFDFDNVAIDSRGNVLAQASMVGSGSTIVVANANGITMLVQDRMAADVVLDVQVASTNRFSLSDTGDIVFRGNFHYLGSTTNYQGMVRYTGGSLILEASSKDPLPGLDGTVVFDDQYGIDGQGVIYFSASSGAEHVIYRKAFETDPVKVVAAGDTLSNSTISQLQQIAVDPAGDLVVWGSFNGGLQFLARYPAGNASATPTVTTFTNGYVSQLYAVNAKGGVVFLGDAGAGYGIYRWTGGSTTPQPMLLRSTPSLTGEPVQDFYSAAVDASGNVYATIRGVDTPWMLVQAGSAARLIATNGLQIATQGNLDLSPQLVPGDRAGPLHVLAGGNQSSIFQVDNRGLLPALIVGDRLPGGATYFGNNDSRKSPSGDLYVTTDSATYHLSNSVASVLVAYPYLFPDGVNYYSPYNVAVNDFNQFVAISGTDHSHQRLAVFDGANFNTIAYFYGSSPYLTPSPAGGTFAGLNELAINASGQVMVIATANNGPSGLFFYDGSTWQTVCAIGSCQIGGETITQANFLRASNNKFCALFNSTVGNQQIDCWEAGAWTILIKRGDNTSDGTQINGFGTYDINRLGDVAVTLYTGLNGPSAFLKTGDTGSYFTVQAALFPASDGAYFQGIYALDLRDDRRVFLLVQDFFGRLIAYEADPQF